MNLKKSFGRNVKYYRFKLHYTQEELASLVDTNPNYISRLELGKHNPSLDMVEKIAAALEVEPSDLFVKNNYSSLPVRVDMVSTKI